MSGGWIVGNADDTAWRTWDQGSPVWTPDRDAATRYHRREDAEAVHREDEDARGVYPYAPGPHPALEAASSVMARAHNAIGTGRYSRAAVRQWLADGISALKEASL